MLSAKQWLLLLLAFVWLQLAHGVAPAALLRLRPVLWSQPGELLCCRRSMLRRHMLSLRPVLWSQRGGVLRVTQHAARLKTGAAPQACAVGRSAATRAQHAAWTRACELRPVLWGGVLRCQHSMLQG